MDGLSVRRSRRCVDFLTRFIRRFPLRRSKEQEAEPQGTSSNEHLGVCTPDISLPSPFRDIFGEGLEVRRTKIYR
jgi:hypothetical protein